MTVEVSTVGEIRKHIKDIGAKLSIPRKKFCDAWLTNGQNGTKAYLQTYPTVKPTSASVGANRLMKRADVKAYIDLMREYSSEEILTHMTVTKERILDEESKLAFIDVRRMFDAEGEFLPPALWPEEIARAIAGLDVTQQWDVATGKWKYTYKIKLNDKGRALGRLETVMGMNKADGLQDGDKDLFKSFLQSVDGDTRGRLPSELEDDQESPREGGILDGYQTFDTINDIGPAAPTEHGDECKKNRRLISCLSATDYHGYFHGNLNNIKHFQAFH